MSLNGALVEDKLRKFKGEGAHVSFKKCPIYTHDGASAKFSTNSHETDYSVCLHIYRVSIKAHVYITTCKPTLSTEIYTGNLISWSVASFVF
jgi:hypothetical protein